VKGCIYALFSAYLSFIIGLTTPDYRQPLVRVALDAGWVG